MPALATPRRVTILTPNKGGGVPAGYTRSTYNGSPLYFANGSLNVTAGHPVFDDGRALYIGA
jgi:hypothetical protein